MTQESLVLLRTFAIIFAILFSLVLLIFKLPKTHPSISKFALSLIIGFIWTLVSFGSAFSKMDQQRPFGLLDFTLGLPFTLSAILNVTFFNSLKINAGLLGIFIGGLIIASTVVYFLILIISKILQTQK